MSKNKQRALSVSEKAIDLVEINNQAGIFSSVRVALAAKTVENGQPQKSNVLVTAINKAFISSKPKHIDKERVEIVLPAENFIFTSLVVDRDKDVVSVIKKELPGDINDWLYNNQIFFHPEKHSKSVVITAVKKDLVDSWRHTLTLANVKMEKLSADFVGYLSCVSEDGLQAIISLGNYYSKLIVVLDGKIIWGETLPFGEKSWWQMIDELKELSDKDILAKYYDLIKQRPRKGSLSEKVTEKLGVLVELVEAGLADFSSFYGKNVETFTLFGSMSSIKGIDVVLSKQLKTPVTIGFCPAKKIKSQNYASAWGVAKLTQNSSIYNIPMARTASTKNSLPSQDDEFVEEIKPVVAKLKSRSIDAAVYNTNPKAKKSSALSIGIVLILLIVLAAGAIWFYSNWQSNQPLDSQTNNSADTNVVAPTNSKTVSTDIRFNFTADTVDASGQRLARTIKVQTNSKATTTNDGLAMASAELAEDEALWPVMFGTDTWLIYRQPLLVMAAQDYLKSLQPTSSESIVVNSIIPKRISASKTAGEFAVLATVEVKMANDLVLNLPEAQDLLATTTITSTSTSTSDTVSEDGEIIIANTPAGWANVRSGSGLSNEIVGKVNDGEKYKVLDQENEWYKIKLSSGDIAWVIKKYTK